MMRFANWDMFLGYWRILEQILCFLELDSLKNILGWFFTPEEKGRERSETTVE
jgi:hypothetical protein